MIEFAQDFTFLGVRPDLRVLDLLDSAANSLLSPDGDGRGESIGTVRVGSDALAERVGTELSLRRDSNRKKLRRFAGIEADVGLATGVSEIADDGRLRFAISGSRKALFPRSRMAPAVLGRESCSFVGLSNWLPGRPGLVTPALRTEDKLLVAE